MKPRQVVEAVSLEKGQIKGVFTRKASGLMLQCAQEFNEGDLNAWVSEAVLTLLATDIFEPREQLGYPRPKKLEVVQALSLNGGKTTVVFTKKASSLMGHASHVIYDGNIGTWVWAAIDALLVCDLDIIGTDGPEPGEDSGNKSAELAVDVAL